MNEPRSIKRQQRLMTAAPMEHRTLLATLPILRSLVSLLDEDGARHLNKAIVNIQAIVDFVDEPIVQTQDKEWIN